MSELSKINEKIDDLRNIVVTHIAATNAYREERDKVVSALTETVWDKQGKAGLATKVDRLVILADDHEEILSDGKNGPGLATRVDRMTQTERMRSWITKTVAAAVIALGLDRLWHIFKP